MAPIENYTNQILKRAVFTKNFNSLSFKQERRAFLKTVPNKICIIAKRVYKNIDIVKDRHKIVPMDEFSYLNYCHRLIYIFSDLHKPFSL